MNTCDNCAFNGRPPYKSPCSECVGFSEWAEIVKPKTNADYIRSMSDEELAEFFCREILLKNFGARACYGSNPICLATKMCSAI